MIPSRTVAALLFLTLGVPAGAGEIRGTCLIRFQGVSTLHDFSGTVRCQPFSAELVKTPDGRTVVSPVEVEVLVDGMDTGNKTRDGQMREMFESDRFPGIYGTVREVDVGRIRQDVRNAGGGMASFDLTLKIRDVERTIGAVVTGFREEGDRVGFDVTFSVSLGDFGLDPPSVLGIIRVHDKVAVTGNVRLEVSSKKKGSPGTGAPEGSSWGHGSIGSTRCFPGFPSPRRKRAERCRSGPGTNARDA